MISKHLVANSFYHTCRYITDKPGAEILFSEGVRSYDYKLMAEDFAMQQALRPEKNRACMHAILSFYPGEKLTDEKMKQVVHEYLQQLDIVNTQVAVAKHTDKAHTHLHIVANMVNNEGSAIKDNWIGLRGKKIAQQLTLKHQLAQSQEKNISLTHLESLNDYEAARYKIYIAIAETLQTCTSIEELEARLKKRGIATEYKFKGQTKEKQGISFKMGEYSFKGSKIDRKFSYLSLEKTLALQQKQHVQPARGEHTKEFFSKPGAALPKENIAHAFDMTEHDMLNEASKVVSDVLNTLLDPGREDESMSKELLDEQRKRKQRKKNRDRNV